MGNNLAGHVNAAELGAEHLWGFTTGVREDVVQVPRIAVCQCVDLQTPLGWLVFAILLEFYPALEANLKVGLKGRHQTREKGLDLIHAAWQGPGLGGEMEHPEDVQEAVLRHHIVEIGDVARPLHLPV